MAILLAGSILGFLRYNFNGAKIFLGDSGSLFLGFALAILSIRSSTKGSTAFSIIVPMIALGLPTIAGEVVVLDSRTGQRLSCKGPERIIFRTAFGIIRDQSQCS